MVNHQPVLIHVISTTIPERDLMHEFGMLLNQQAMKNNHILCWHLIDSIHAYRDKDISLFDFSNINIKWVFPTVKKTQMAATLNELMLHKNNIFIITPDMINNVKDIPDFLDTSHDGFDVIFSWRKERKGVNKLRVLSTITFNFIMRKLHGFPVHDMNISMLYLSSRFLNDFQLINNKKKNMDWITPLKNNIKSMTEVPIITYELESRRSTYKIKDRLTSILGRVIDIVKSV